MTRSPLLAVTRIRGRLRLAFKPADVLVIIALVTAIFWFQHASGAYQSDFSADEDEPAHVVSSLMVRDYITHDFPGSPLRFAETYYLHYPKVAIGHWPPLFYTAEATWMIVFGRTRAALLSFVAVAGAMLAISIFFGLRRDCGTLISGVSVAVLVSMPLFRTGVYTVAPDILLAALAFWAAIVYGSYLQSGDRRHAFLFGVILICTMLVHGRGAMLLFLPPIAALLAGRGSLKTKWLPALLLLCAATLFIPRLLGQADASSFASIAQNAWAFLSRLGASMSWPVVLIATIGGIQVFRHRSTQMRRIAMAALVLSGCMFQALVNAPFVDRYLLTVAAAIAVLFGAGLQFLLSVFARSTFESRAAKIAVAILACWLIGKNVLVKAVKPDAGCHRFIVDIRSWNSPSDIYLVGGDPVHEGALIAEVALADSRMQHIVLRASKVLAASSWSGRGYRLRFTTSNAVRCYLDDAHVGLIFAQERSATEHMRLLAETLREHSELWTELPTKALPDGFQLFRRMTPVPQGKPEIRIDMRDKLGRYLKLDE